jgi:peptide-methionine (S)-S-oxide reductase
MRHLKFHLDLEGPFPDKWQLAGFAMGCFWGAERLFWQTSGVKMTAVGYCGGQTPSPTYENVCTGQTGHAETVRIHYAPDEISFAKLVQIFFENHDPTQYHRQGNDIGSQYRSVIFYTNEQQRQTAEKMWIGYDRLMTLHGFGPVQTEIKPLTNFFLAETYHQQYLAQNPTGYCGLGGTGVNCPLPEDVSANGQQYNQSNA